MVYTLNMNYTSQYQKMLQASDVMQEIKDCAVIALAIVCGLTYVKAHKLLEQTGRKPLSITHRGNINNVLTFLNIRTRDVTKQYRTLGAKTIRTLGRVIADRKGIYLAYTYDHIMAVKDGIIHDWLDGSLHRIIRVEKLRHLKGNTNDR